jgi:aspartyl-tRNA(Asn)/glutamyl-tRNA(Gln) amidotransferase subunit B
LGTRTETKNVNSFRSIERAVRYEIQRQATLLTAGTAIIQETRHWHEDTGVTSPGRPKSDADDYRYFPEPDLLPIEPTEETIARLKAALPEAPVAKRRRLREAWQLSDTDFNALINAGLVDAVDQTIALGCGVSGAKKWWLGEMSRIANERGQHPTDLVTPSQIAELEAVIAEGTITDKIARDVLAGMIAGEGSARQVIESRGLAVVSDDSALLAAIDEALAAEPDVLEKIRDGKVQAAGALIGHVMKAMGGKADAAKVRELILKRAND